MVSLRAVQCFPCLQTQIGLLTLELTKLSSYLCLMLLTDTDLLIEQSDHLMVGVHPSGWLFLRPIFGGRDSLLQA